MPKKVRKTLVDAIGPINSNRFAMEQRKFAERLNKIGSKPSTKGSVKRSIGLSILF